MNHSLSYACDGSENSKPNAREPHVGAGQHSHNPGLRDIAFITGKFPAELLNDLQSKLDELKAGVYKFVFEKAGFKKVTKDKVVVRTDEAFQLNIEMIQDNGFDLMPSPLHFTDF